MSPLYRRVLGDRFSELPREVQALHDLDGRATWRGTADVVRGTSLLSRLAGWITSLPPDGPGQPLSVTFEARDEAEVWSRTFGRSVFRTVQFARGTDLCEQAGPVMFRFAAEVDDGVLRLRILGMSIFGIPAPRFLLPVIATEEREIAGRYRFRVDSALPLIGLLVRYEGSLVRSEGPSSA